MTGTIGGVRLVRNGIVSAVLGCAVVLVPATAAHADPGTPTPVPTPMPAATATVSGGAQAPTAAAPTAAVGDVLDQLAEEYAVGAGGGQLSTLLKTSLKLRAMGFKPSKANLEALTKAMDYRPNQIPLIEALKDTIAYQGKIKAQMEILQQYQQRQGSNSAVMGAGQMPADSNPANLPGAPQGTGAVPPSAGAPMLPTAPTS